MKKIISDGNDYVLGWWIPKAEKRYRKLVKEKSIETDTLWYEKIDDMKVESWLRSRGVIVSTSNKKIDTRKVDRMFRKVGIDKNKFYDSLIKVGTDGMKTKQMKEEWSVDNPTKNNCYMVSGSFTNMDPKELNIYQSKLMVIPYLIIILNGMMVLLLI